MANVNSHNALAVVKQMVFDGEISLETAEKYFPELAENKDEKISNEIRGFIYWSVIRGSITPKQKEKW